MVGAPWVLGRRGTSTDAPVPAGVRGFHVAPDFDHTSRFETPHGRDLGGHTRIGPG
jgi:hypothetical protein